MVRGQGHDPRTKLASYIARAAFWDILRYILKETIIYFAAFAKVKKVLFSF